jgi:DNA replication protein DnaC
MFNSKSDESTLDDFGKESGAYIYEDEDDEDDEEEAFEREMKTSANKKKDDLTKHTTKYIQYSQQGDAFVPCGKTVKKLKPGIYKIYKTDSGPLFEPSPIKSDEWLTFRNELIEDVLEEIQKFWEKRSIFKEHGYLQRRGYMFYGPPGTGKTVLIKQITQKIVESGGIVFICDTHPNVVQDGLKYFSRIEPDRDIVCLFEDIDALVDNYGDAHLLTLLDGEDSVDHVLNIATTNYPEKLDKRLIGRPRRFDRVVKITYPEPDMRLYYFVQKLKVSESEAKKWVDATDSFTFAAMTELVISVKCLGNPFDKSVKRIRNLLDLKPSSADFNTSKMGF